MEKKSFSLRSVTGRKVSGTVAINKTGYTVSAGKCSVSYRYGEYGICSMDEAAKVAVLSGDV